MRIVLLLNAVVVTFLICSPSNGGDTVELINKFLQDTKQSAVRKQATNKSPRLDDIRVAQKSVLVDLGAEKLSDEKPTPVVTSKEDVAKVAKEEAERKRIESGIDRKMRNLESSLKSEEKRLEKRLAELDKKRNTALEKGDEKTLKRIESMEKQAIVTYEKKIERLLNSAVAAAKPAPVKRPVASQPGRASQSRSPYAQPQRNAAQSQPKQPAPPQKRRRMRLWPFN